MGHFWTPKCYSAPIKLGHLGHPKWVIFRFPRARARARARGDKIDFVLEMPFWGFKMDYPKMTHFGSLFGPPFLGGNTESDYLNAYQFLAKNWPKMGDFGCPGVPGQKWKNGVKLVLGLSGSMMTLPSHEI